MASLLCVPMFSLRFSLPCLRGVHSAEGIYFRVYASSLRIFQVSLVCSFLLDALRGAVRLYLTRFLLAYMRSLSVSLLRRFLRFFFYVACSGCLLCPIWFFRVLLFFCVLIRGRCSACGSALCIVGCCCPCKCLLYVLIQLTGLRWLWRQEFFSRD